MAGQGKAAKRSGLHSQASGLPAMGPVQSITLADRPDRVREQLIQRQDDVLMDRAGRNTQRHCLR